MKSLKTTQPEFIKEFDLSQTKHNLNFKDHLLDISEIKASDETLNFNESKLDETQSKLRIDNNPNIILNNNSYKNRIKTKINPPTYSHSKKEVNKRATFEDFHTINNSNNHGTSNININNNNSMTSSSKHNSNNDTIVVSKKLINFDPIVAEISLISDQSLLNTNSLYKGYLPHVLSVGGKPDFITTKWDIENNVWLPFKQLKIERIDFSSVMYKDKKALVFGGKILNHNNVETITDSIDLLDFEEMSLKRLEIKLKQAKISCGSIYWDGKLYVCGGFNGRDVLNNFEYFDKKKKLWVDLPKMLTRRKDFYAVLSPENVLFVIGGIDDKE